MYPSYSSSQNDRVYQLSGKLTSILSTLETDKGYYIEQIEKRISTLENNIYDSIEQEGKKFKIISDRVQQVNEKIEELKFNRERFFKEKLDELAEFEDAMNEEIGPNEVRKREMETKFLRVIDDRTSSLSSEISRENKSRKEAFESLNEYCHSNLSKVKELLKKELVEREENSDKFSNGILARIQGTKQLIQAEKESREKAEEALLAMLQDLVARMKKEIEDERNEREESEETLLGLLEETCSKLNNISKF